MKFSKAKLEKNAEDPLQHALTRYDTAQQGQIEERAIEQTKTG